MQGSTFKKEIIKQTNKGWKTVMAALSKGHKGCNKSEKHMNHPQHAVLKMENISLGRRNCNKA